MTNQHNNDKLSAFLRDSRMDIIHTPSSEGMQPLHHFGTRPFRMSRPAYLAEHLLLTRRILYLNCRDFIIKREICQRFCIIFLVLFTKHYVSGS